MPWPTNPSEPYFGRGLWAWVTDTWVKLVSTAAGALHVYVKGGDVAILVKQQQAALFTPGIHGYDGAAWRKLSLLWGYTDRWAVSPTGVSTGDPATNVVTIDVPEGYVYKLEGWQLEHNDTVARSVFLSCVADTASVQMYSNAAFVPNTQAFGINQFTLKEGDHLQFTVWGLVTGKTAYLNVWGSKMAVA